MRAAVEHPLVPTLKRQLVERQIERREFLRYATLLGMAAPTAYAFVAKVTGEKLIAPAEAQGALPKGGTLRLAMRCQDLVMNRLYRRNSQMSDQFAQDKRLKRAEFFLINRFAVAAAVLGAMVGRTGVKTIEPPS